MQRIPLEERLKISGGYVMPAAGKLYLDTFFGHLSEMSGSPSYRQFYQEAVEKYPDIDLENLFLAKFAYEAIYGFWAPMAGTELLYRVLAEPFADEKIYQEKEGNRK